MDVSLYQNKYMLGCAVLAPDEVPLRGWATSDPAGNVSLIPQPLHARTMIIVLIALNQKSRNCESL